MISVEKYTFDLYDPFDMKKVLRINQKGFTLIEIFSLLVILGILTAIVYPMFYEAQRNAEAKTLLTVKNDLLTRANGCFSKSMIANNGQALAIDCATYQGLGLATLADVTGVYSNYVGTWGRPSDTVITYTYKTPGLTPMATFTLAVNAPTSPTSVASSSAGGGNLATGLSASSSGSVVQRPSATYSPTQTISAPPAINFDGSQ